MRVDRRVLGLVVVLLAACGSSKPAPTPGATCAVNSDCNNPLSCTFGRCHESCVEARDCPTGERCVRAPTGAGVCQLNAQCIYRSDCPVPLACALDRQCRSQCVTDIDCPTRTQKCVQPDKVCAEPDEVDPASGKLKMAQSTPVPEAPPPDGGTSNGGTGGSDAGGGSIDASSAPDAPGTGGSGGSPGDGGPGSDGSGPTTATCSDGIKNGKETDIDCGGVCGPCAPNKGCTVGLDCASAVCGMDGKCAASSCSDGKVNGDETGVDCGGSCPPCPKETDWATGALAYRGMMGKQVSFHCPAMGSSASIYGTDTYTDDSSVCTAAVHSGIITFAGGDVTIEIRAGQASYVGSKRNNITSNAYSAYDGSYVFIPLKVPNCGNLMKDGDETDVDCGGKSCQACTSGRVCASDADCAGTPCSGRCAVAADWSSKASDYRGMNGARIPFICPANGVAGGVWGTDSYTDDSSVCSAAVHAGKITLAAGGTVIVEIRPGQPTYMGSSRNGIDSNSYGEFTGSFVFP